MIRNVGAIIWKFCSPRASLEQERLAFERQCEQERFALELQLDQLLIREEAVTAREREQEEKYQTREQVQRQVQRQLQEQRRQLQMDAAQIDRTLVDCEGWLGGVEKSRLYGLAIQVPQLLVKVAKCCSNSDGDHFQCSCLVVTSSRRQAANNTMSLIRKISEFSTRKCDICFELATRSAGLLCNNGHFICDSCFESMVLAILGEGLSRIQQDEGHVWCPLHAHGCDAEPFSKRSLAAHLPAEVWDNFLQVREEVIKEIGRQEERSFQQKYREQDGERLHIEYVTEQILTHRCPNCQQAFQDFDGCLALTCHRCRAGFCGLCFAHCGQDAHIHLLQSCQFRQLASDAYFLDISKWQSFHTSRQDEKIANYLKRLPLQSSAGVERAIRKLRR